MLFYTNPNGGSVSERMRIDSNGFVGIGTSSTSFSSGGTGYTPKFAVNAGSGNIAYFLSSGGGSGITINKTGAEATKYLISFDNGSTRVGDITSNGTSTTYGTSSDYRLKENVVADWDATTRLKQLNPVRLTLSLTLTLQSMAF